MNHIFVLYLVNILFSLFLGFSVFQKYRNLGGVFFLIFTLLFSSWLFFYTLNYSAMSPGEVILTGKISFSLSFLSLYSFLFFSIFFQKKSSKILRPFFFVVLSLFFCSLYIFIFTPIVVSGVSYDRTFGDYYENFGWGYNLFVALSALSIFLSIYFFRKTAKKLSYIDRMRFFYIGYSLLFFFIVGVFCLLVLPIFGFRIFEHTIIFWYTPFLVSGFYVLHRYYFVDFRVIINKLSAFILSLLFSLTGIYAIKTLQIKLTMGIQNFWDIEEKWSVFDIVIVVILSFFLYFLLSRFVFKNYSEELFQKKLMILKKKIPYTLNRLQLKNFLCREFQTEFGIQTQLYLFQDNEKMSSELYHFFQKNHINFCINDIVFLEEHKHKFKITNLKKSLDNNFYLYFGLYDKLGECTGYLAFGEKMLRSVYSLVEVELLQEFVYFLMYHLHYLDFYENIQQLNFDLDRRVDEKTMQFNHLVNRQKEFIQVVSHELTRPITNATLILENILESDISKKVYEKDVKIVFGEIQKAGSLLKTIFKTETYDVQDIKLFLQDVDFSRYMYDELNVYKKTISGFEFHVQADLRYIKIDTVQFREVIANLIHNGVKFANANAPKIIFNCRKEAETIFISCEDNGTGITFDSGDIFEKYYSKQSTQLGLGLGLYLCRRIIELHGWKITSGSSTVLGGAQFTIKISK